VSIGAQTGETTDVTTVETGETTAGTVATEPEHARRWIVVEFPSSKWWIRRAGTVNATETDRGQQAHERTAAEPFETTDFGGTHESRPTCTHDVAHP
jgi:hypothetical protein